MGELEKERKILSEIQYNKQAICPALYTIGMVVVVPEVTMQDEVAFSGFGLISAMMDFTIRAIMGMVDKFWPRTNCIRNMIGE